MKKQLLISLFLTLACIMLLVIIRNQSLAMAAPPLAQDSNRDYIVASTLAAPSPPPAVTTATNNQAASTPNQSTTNTEQPEAEALPDATTDLELSEPPVATQVDALTNLPAIPENAPVIAFTFDDGPSATHTPQLLAGLKERNVQASFFVLGNRAELYPEIILQIVQDGHTLGNHGYDHQDAFTDLDIYQLNAQVGGTNEILQQIIGHSPPQMVRPPYGAIDEQSAIDTNMAVMMWNIDPRDWDCRNADQVYNHILDYAVDGGIIVLHDIFPETVEASLRAIDTLKEQGWAIVNLEQLYAHHNKALVPGSIYRGPLE